MFFFTHTSLNLSKAGLYRKLDFGSKSTVIGISLIFSILIFSANAVVLTQNAEAQFSIPKPIPQPIQIERPDLIIESLTYSPANPDTDDLITFKAVVKNIGAVQASKSTLEFRIGGETPGPNNQFTVPILDPGKTYTETRQTTLKVAQNYGVTAIADALSVVAESNEDNNKKVATFTVTKAVITLDSDGDGVPDDRDRCPKEYGSANNYGCTIKLEQTPVPVPKYEPVPTRDNTAPFLVVPRDIVIDAITSQGTKVSFVVTAVDDIDGKLKPTCTKSSGSLFLIETTTVDCWATDSAGNTAKKSFSVTVKSIKPTKPTLAIPAYVKNIATFWEHDQIDDASFVGAIDYMIENEIITIPDLAKTQKTTTAKKAVPDWVKTTTKFWTSGATSDKEYADTIQWLVKEGIIVVETGATGLGETSSPEVPLRVILVFDESGSVDQREFNLLNQFSLDLVNSLTMPPTEVGVVMFSSNSRNIINPHPNQQSVVYAINNFVQRHGETCIPCGMSTAITQFTTSDVSAATQIMIILTDGLNNVQTSEIETQVNDAENAGIIRLVIGVGSGVNINQLNQIASDSTALGIPQTVFLASDFNALSTIVDSLIQTTDTVSESEICSNINSLLNERHALEEENNTISNQLQYYLDKESLDDSEIEIMESLANQLNDIIVEMDSMQEEFNDILENLDENITCNISIDGIASENMDFLALQNLMQNESRKFQTLSAASQARHDIAMNSIRNIRA